MEFLFFFLELLCNVEKVVKMGASHSKTLLSTRTGSPNKVLQGEKRTTELNMIDSQFRANATISVDNDHRNFKQNFNLGE